MLIDRGHRLHVSSPQVASSATLSQTIIAQLEKCPSDIYVVVSQPGVHADDYSERGFAPRLEKAVSGRDKHIKSFFTVAQVLGEIDTSVLTAVLEDKCGAGTLHVDASSELSQSSSKSFAGYED
jgi:hypothetical protein